MQFSDYKAVTFRHDDVPDMRYLYIMLLMNSHSKTHLIEYALIREETTVGVFVVKPTGEVMEDSLTILRLINGDVKFVLSESRIEFTKDQPFLKRFVAGLY